MFEISHCASAAFENLFDYIFAAELCYTVSNDFFWQVRKNVLDVSYHISQYQTIISELRGEIGRLKEKIQVEGGGLSNGPASGVKKAELQELREQMVANFKDQMNLRWGLWFSNKT